MLHLSKLCQKSEYAYSGSMVNIIGFSCAPRFSGRGVLCFGSFFDGRARCSSRFWPRQLSTGAARVFLFPSVDSVPSVSAFASLCCSHSRQMCLARSNLFILASLSTLTAAHFLFHPPHGFFGAVLVIHHDDLRYLLTEKLHFRLRLSCRRRWDQA